MIARGLLIGGVALVVYAAFECWWYAKEALNALGWAEGGELALVTALTAAFDKFMIGIVFIVLSTLWRRVAALGTGAS